MASSSAAAPAAAAAAKPAKPAKPPPLPLAEVQAGVRRGVAAAALTTAAAAGAALAWLPDEPLARAAAAPHEQPSPSALALAAAWQLPKAAVLLWHVVRVGNMRYGDRALVDGAGYDEGAAAAADAAAATAEAELRVERAILTNTTEQLLASALSALGFAAVVEPRLASKLLPAQAACFVAGRVLFARGYRRGANGRAYGFALTSLPTMAAVAAGLVALANMVRGR